MSSLLYLDTARLGRMSPSAQRAHRDFARFAGEEGCPLYFEEFLARGFEARPDLFPSHYPGLSCWPGITGLKQQLRKLTRSPAHLRVSFANRSAQLMKMAARLLFLTCKNVLVTDLGWPAYRAILNVERERKSRHLTVIAIRDAILRDTIDEDTVVSLVCSEFRRNHCDGLFLTAVTHDGVRLPVERIVNELEATEEPRFTVVDGAQAFCHTVTDLSHAAFDLCLVGSHKWLGAYYPLGLAFYGKVRSLEFIETIRGDMLNRGDLDDPLLRFTEQLETAQLDGSTETVNLTPLFSCAGAAHDANEDRCEPESRFQTQLRNSRLVVEATDGLEWFPVQPVESFQSGIIILESKRSSVRSAPAHAIREAFQRQGLAVTGYENGRIRLSMPQHPFSQSQLDSIRSALRRIS